MEPNPASTALTLPWILFLSMGCLTPSYSFVKSVFLFFFGKVIFNLDPFTGLM